MNQYSIKRNIKCPFQIKNKYYISSKYEIPFTLVNKKYQENPDIYIINYFDSIQYYIEKIDMDTDKEINQIKNLNEIKNDKHGKSDNQNDSNLKYYMINKNENKET
ncbi:hypothetical protein PIROE2DRAFT_8065 [Piromyces sp. E2]|nr:hypothetical protein PIROE2DRAFT_8065 [Piromyces sp. E2]|eukprot:OUM65002.1 hypothetical protein PIROE2DRAFT_8065 [Piromyces sp. E2]